MQGKSMDEELEKHLLEMEMLNNNLFLIWNSLDKDTKIPQDIIQDGVYIIYSGIQKCLEEIWKLYEEPMPEEKC